MIQKIYQIVFDFIDDRLDIRGLIEKDICKKVPVLNWTYYFGGLSFSIFITQVITGCLLLVYYQPNVTEAYDSVVKITNNVPFGWLFRGFHVWGAHLMIIFVFCHLTRIFFQAAYKKPRELNWMVGVCLMCCVLTFSFTGYLLPWTQLSYWATTVGTEFPAAVPIIGEYIKILARGGEDVSQITLSRFFVIHVTVLPLIVLSLLGSHMMIVRTLGISETPSNRKKKK